MPTTITQTTTWMPTPDVIQHNGRALDPKMTFFAPPPSEIGSVVTAYSSVKNNKASLRIQWQFIAEVLVMIMGLILFFGPLIWVALFKAIEYFLGNGRSNFLLASSFILTLLVIYSLIRLIVNPCFDREFVCSYVGQQGVAEYRWTKANGLDGKILLFSNFKALRKRIEQAYVKPYQNRGWVYTGTNYCFTWCETLGKKVLFTLSGDNKPWFNWAKQKSSGCLKNDQSIVGLFFSKSGQLRRNDPYHLAAASERVWTSLYLQQAQAELEQFGSVQFLVADGGVLEIQPGLLRVVNSTGTHEYGAHEVQLTYKAGKVVIERLDVGSPQKSSDACVIEHSMIDNLEAFFTLYHAIVAPEKLSPKPTVDF